MSKAFQWFCRFCAVLVAFFTLIGASGFLLAMLLYAGFTAELDSRDDPAENALNAIGLTDYAQYAPSDHLTIGDTLTAFIMFKYDNREDNTDLHAGIMARAVASPDWQVGSVTTKEYTNLMKAHLPEAAFLLPDDVTFDARYQTKDAMAFFDQDTGLMICHNPGKTPRPGSIRADKLSVPHNGHVYTMETHGGFHGDGTTFYALIVPEEQRAAFEATLTVHADWHEGTVTHAEYTTLQNCFYEYPGLLPSADVTFDWWSYVDTYARSHPDKESDFDVHPDFPAAMREAGACWSLNWLVALYDADTGLFIYYEYDS